MILRTTRNFAQDVCSRGLVLWLSSHFRSVKRCPPKLPSRMAVSWLVSMDTTLVIYNTKSSPKTRCSSQRSGGGGKDSQFPTSTCVVLHSSCHRHFLHTFPCCRCFRGCEIYPLTSQPALVVHSSVWRTNPFVLWFQNQAKSFYSSILGGNKSKIFFLIWNFRMNHSCWELDQQISTVSLSESVTLKELLTCRLELWLRPLHREGLQTRQTRSPADSVRPTHSAMGRTARKCLPVLAAKEKHQCLDISDKLTKYGWKALLKMKW